jgi:hypothetical protein
VSGGGALSNTTVTSATYTAPAAASSALTVTVTATSVADTTKTGTTTITVPAAPAVTTLSSALAGKVGTPYSVQLAGSGGISPYTWTVVSGSTLPAGLSLSTAGVISGTPLAAGVGTTNVTFQMKDSGTATALTVSQPLGVTITAAPAIAFGGVMPNTGTFNLAYAGSAAASGGAGALTYSLGGGALPTGVLLNAASGAVAGTTTAAGTFNFTIKAADAFGDSNAQSYQIVVSYPNVNIAPVAGSLALAVTGQTYSQALTASGGSGAGFVWTVNGLSNGLTSTASGATLTISGPATTTGTVNFTAMVTDGAGNSTGALSYSIQVYSPVTLPATIPATLASTATVNAAYSGTVVASGGSGNYSWTVTGQSDGLNTASSGGTLTVSGTPASAGTVSLSVSVKDTTTGVTAGPYIYAITAYNALTLPTPNPATLGPATLSTPYTGTIVVSGGSGSYSWTVTGLPSGGLSYSTTGGTLTISGTPGSAGTVSFGVSVKDNSTNTTVGPFTYGVTVYNPLTLPTPNPVSLPSTATVNAAYTGTITASGGSGSGYTYTVTGLPANGLSFASAGGVLTISGTPTTTTAVSFGVSAKDSAGLTAGPVTYTITPYNNLTLPAPNPATLGSGIVSTPYTGTIVAVGGSGNYTWTVTGLPAGGLSSSSGSTLTISGTPTSTGAIQFGVSVKDNSTNATAGPFTYSVTAYNALTLPAPNPVSLPSTATVSVAYTGTITASGGTGTGYTYTVTGLPANGLSYSSAGGVLTISGTPTTPTPVSFGVSAKDSAGLTAGPVTYTITPYNALTLPNPNPSTLGPATLSLPYSGTIVASGGSGNYSWTVTGLPADSLNYSTIGGTLTISGTPGTATSVPFNVTLKDTTTNVSVGPFIYTVTVYNSVTLPNPNPSTLGPADANSNYTGTIVAAGGSGNYTWTVTGLSDGLTSATSGSTLTVSGKPTSSGSVTFNVTIKDTSTNTVVGPLTYTITVNSALALPPPNPASLPAGYANIAYTGTISASGGSGSYSWQVTGLSDNLTPNPIGGILTISGTPGATAATVTFNVTLTDTVTNASFTQNGYTIAITVPTPVTLPTPNPTSLPSATVTVPYTGSINSSGGVPPYTWSVNGVSIPNTGAAVLISDGISVSNNGTNVLSVGGTPTAIQTVNLTNVMVTDSNSSNQTNSYTVVVNAAGSQVSGQISLSNNCGGSQPIFTVSINTTPTATTTTTDTNGNYTFNGIPNGTYTITPSIPGASSSLFYPASYTGVALNNSGNNNVSGENFNVVVGYTVSGTLSYTTGGTAQTGQTYLVLNNNNCGGYGTPGTSITSATLGSGGAFSIRGVPPGAYTLDAWLDPLGQGTQNAIDPTGAALVTVTNANVTNAAVTMTNPTFATPTSNPAISTILPNASGMLIEFTPSTNTNKEEDATQYTVEWSTSPTLGGGTGGGQFATIAGSHTFPAIGTKSNFWILNNTVTGTNSFISGTTYYFQARSFNALDTGNPHPSGWCNFTSSGCTGITGFTGVVIGTPACTGTCTTVSGAVTIPSGITLNAGAPLYIGIYQNGSGNGPSTIYATEVASPVVGGSGNSYSLTIPSGSGYVLFGILDQNNDGEIDTNDVSNARNDNSNGVTVSGTTMTQNLTLPSTNSSATVTTQYQSGICSGCTSPYTDYQIYVEVRESNKLPVAITLASGPNLIVPIDISGCSTCGSQQFDYSATLPGGTPNVGDTYNFTVTYSDGSQDTGSTVNGAVTAFGSTGAVVGPSDLVTNLSPSATSSTSTTPTFTWTFPANPSNYVYSFYISPNNCTGSCNDIWQIPSNNSNSNGFTYAETGTGTTGTLTWGTDPIPGDSSTPTGPLSAGSPYNWSIQVQDTNGNQADSTTWYQP